MNATTPWIGFSRIPEACKLAAVSRATLYKMATRNRGLFRKNGTATIVDLAKLKRVIDAEFPDAEINVVTRA